MNPLKLLKLLVSPNAGWSELVESQPSLHRLYLLHVVPLALIPALVLYTVSRYQMQTTLLHHEVVMMALAVFLVQLVVIPAMASIVRQLAEVAEIYPSYRQAFTLTAIAPTPLWIATLFCLLPNLALNIFITVLAMISSAMLVYCGVPVIFNISDKKDALLLFGAIAMAGIIAWSFLMVCTLMVWGSLQSLPFAG
ncbi:YIP1 family protein [Methylobacillus caricis]|uniref:Yip1 family protein n=1 Tax=Methylobacillus caricis TaxID=1971611 RepID=UPI001CFFFB79|nr:Yip1 family protein [Methylobacillus caricis]MCB5187617.1 YIP1 family protein [Methylobacillus caricis]